MTSPSLCSRAFCDLQVNGYAAVDFNQDGLGAADLHHACTRLRADGVDRILATVITEDVETMCGRLATIVRLRQGDELARSVIAGIHIEGPFLDEHEGFRGAHPKDAIRPGDADVMDRLLEAAGGLTRIVTLAPEQDAGLRVTRMLAGRGIVVSAGHTNASRDQLRGAIDAGLSMFTHLGNGCPMNVDRHDNIIQRALSLADRLWCCFIADGVHVPLFALGNYLRLVGPARAIIVTDAIAAAGLGPGRYTLGRWTVDVGEDMAARAPDGSHLIGSAITMRKSQANLQEQLGLTEEACRLMMRDNPLKAIGLPAAESSD